MENVARSKHRGLAATLSLLLAAHASGACAKAPAGAELHSASTELQRVSAWIAESGDNRGMPYILIDKVNAQVFAFDARGKLKGEAPALLGMARGDRLLAPNSAVMEDIVPQQRITPAGRFVSRLAIDSKGEELLVLDYDASISLHAVVKGTPEERRAERLGSATSKDNRISYGCINVPKAFYADVVSPAFAHTRGVVYILPEMGNAAELFGIRSPGGADAVAHGGAGAPGLRGAAASAAP